VKKIGKILMVHNYSSWGGNLATVRALCLGLPDYGFDVALAAPAGEPYVGRFAEAGVPTFDIEIKSKYDLGAARRYEQLVDEEDFDVVHTHTRRADFVAARGGWRAGAIIVSTQHGQINLDRHTLAVKRDLPARFYCRCLRKYFDCHVAVSAEIAEELRERCGVPEEKIVNIPNGIDTRPFLEAAGERLSFRHEIGALRWTVVVTVVASLDSKGHGELLEAVAQVISRGVDLRLVVVGEGQWGLPEIRRRAEELGLTKSINLLGFRDDVPRVLAGSDIFVLPTPSEGLSIAIMEAMAAGLPVVTTRVGGNPELVEDGRTGRLVSVGDAAALAEAIESLARDTNRRAKGRAGQSRVALEFTADRMIKNYAALYKKLLEMPEGSA
jgi:glycosyltransferase involved in cell wall biosynthesis